MLPNLKTIEQILMSSETRKGHVKVKEKCLRTIEILLLALIFIHSLTSLGVKKACPHGQMHGISE